MLEYLRKEMFSKILSDTITSYKVIRSKVLGITTTIERDLNEPLGGRSLFPNRTVSITSKFDRPGYGLWPREKTSHNKTPREDWISLFVAEKMTYRSSIHLICSWILHPYNFQEEATSRESSHDHSYGSSPHYYRFVFYISHRINSPIDISCHSEISQLHSSAFSSRCQ